MIAHNGLRRPGDPGATSATNALRVLVLLVRHRVSNTSPVGGVLRNLELFLEQVGVDLVALRLGSAELLFELGPLAQLPLLDLIQLRLTLFLVLATFVDVLGWVSVTAQRVKQTRFGHFAAASEVG